jgi:hypothetical protein
MSELENQRSITTKIIDKKLTASEKQLLTIYKSSLTNIRNKLLELNERSTWTQTDLMKYDRLNKLQDQILLEIKELSNKVYTEIKNTNKDITVTEYNRSSYGYTKEVGVFLSFDRINTELIKSIVEMPYPNIPLSDFIKKIGSATYEKIKVILGSTLLTGDGVQTASKQIKDLLGVSYKEALRIARTEGLRARSKAQLEVTNKAKNLGLDIKKRWLSTLDFRTREDHRKLDRQYADDEGYFHVSGYKAQAPRMFGVASLDINCRCTYTEEVVGISEPIMKRKDNITKELIDNMDYNTWYQKYRVKS